MKTHFHQCRGIFSYAILIDNKGDISIPQINEVFAKRTLRTKVCEKKIDK